MKNNIFLTKIPSKMYLLVTAVTTPIFCAETAKPETNQTYEITVQCNENLQKINQDYGQILYYFKGAFQGFAERARPGALPSQLLAYFQTEQSGIDKAIQKNFMPATQYVALVSKHNADFDDTFQKARSTPSAQGAGNEINPWLTVHNLFDQKLKDVVIQFKTALVQQDANIVGLAKKGVIFSGNTIIVNSDFNN